MIDYSEIRRLVEVHLSTNFTTLPVAYENTYVDPPNFEHVEIINTDMRSEPLEMGIPARMVYGSLIVEIYTKLGSGTAKARQAASSLCTMLSGSAQISGVNFDGTAEFVSVGKVGDSGLYQHNLIVPYSYAYGI